MGHVNTASPSPSASTPKPKYLFVTVVVFNNKTRPNVQHCQALSQTHSRWYAQEVKITGAPEARLFTFFSRLAQAEKRTKTKGFWSSCNLYFLSMHIVLHFYVSCLLLQILYLAPILGGDQCQWLQDVRKYCQATGTGIGDWGMGIERCPQYQVMPV